MQVSEVLVELQALGSERYKNTLMKNHGVLEPFFGVKIGDMKSIQKRIKKDYQLALDLFATGNYDAMYFAGLIADDAKMTKKDLNRWVKLAKNAGIATATVAWVAAESPHGYELALQWIESKRPLTAAAGWATLSSLVSIRPDSELDIKHFKALIGRVKKSIHSEADIVRYHMNNFIIAAGCYIKDLNQAAVEAGKAIGPVTADLGNNNCKIPSAPDYINKVAKMGRIGVKRKTAKC